MIRSMKTRTTAIGKMAVKKPSKKLCGGVSGN